MLLALTEDFLLIPQSIVQITCLFDPDIVFQPNGNFDEFYPYVRNLISLL